MNILPSQQWFTIAKTEYRISINSIAPGLKKYFIPFVIVFVAFWPTILTPWLLESLFDQQSLLLASQIIPLIYDVILLNIFLIFLTMQISLGIKDIKVGYIEFLLSAPTKSSDVVFGEFFGKLPFYFLGLVFISGLITGIFTATGTDPLIVLIMTILFAVNFLIAYWIGTIIGFYLKAQISKSSKMKDLGKALSFILIIPAIFVMYGTMGILMNYVETDILNLNISELLLIFPSTWIAKISNQLLVMQNVENLYNFDFVYYILTTLIFIFGVIFFGHKLTNRVYNLEPSSFSQSVVTPHNFSFKILKFIGGNGQFGILLANNYKNYIRRFENLSKLVYTICLMFAMIIFFNNMELDTFFSYFISQIFSALLAGFVISEMTMQGKEKFLLYKQTPLKDWQFVISKLAFYLLLILPIVLIFNLLTVTMIPEFILQDFLLNLFAIILIAVALIILSTGIFLINPPFSEKAPEFVMNLQIIIFLSALLFFSMLISIKDLAIFGESLGEVTFFQIQILHGLIIFSAGIILLFLGKKKLENLE